MSNTFLVKFWSSSCGICGRMAKYDSKVAEELGIGFVSVQRTKADIWKRFTYLAKQLYEDPNRMGYPTYILAVGNDLDKLKAIGEVRGGGDKGTFRRKIQAVEAKILEPNVPTNEPPAHPIQNAPTLGEPVVRTFTAWQKADTYVSPRQEILCKDIVCPEGLVCVGGVCADPNAKYFNDQWEPRTHDPDFQTRDPKCEPAVNDIKISEGQICPKTYGEVVTFEVDSTCCEPNNGKFSISVAGGPWEGLKGHPGVTFPDAGNGPNDHGSGEERKKLRIECDLFTYDIKDGSWDIKWEGECDQKDGSFSSHHKWEAKTDCPGKDPICSKTLTAQITNCPPSAISGSYTLNGNADGVANSNTEMEWQDNGVTVTKGIGYSTADITAPAVGATKTIKLICRFKEAGCDLTSEVVCDITGLGDTGTSPPPDPSPDCGVTLTAGNTHDGSQAVHPATKNVCVTTTGVNVDECQFAWTEPGGPVGGVVGTSKCLDLPYGACDESRTWNVDVTYKKDACDLKATTTVTLQSESCGGGPTPDPDPDSGNKCAGIDCNDPCLVCDPATGSCVPKCGPGFVCDPLTGNCENPIQPDCISHSDCGDPCLQCMGNKCIDKCPPEQVCENGVCLDKDPCADVICRDDQICENGVCICPPGLVEIDGVCQVPATDPCDGVICRDDQICENGVCICPPGLVEIGGICQAPQCVDDSGCGDCETCVDNKCQSTCRADQVCENDVCVCPPGHVEVNGACIPGDCITDGDCDGANCQKCVDNTCTNYCRDDQVCDGAGTCKCPDGYVEDNGVCVEGNCVADTDCDTANCEKCVDNNCTNYCRADQVCDGAGNCVCPEGFVEHEGQCVDACEFACCNEEFEICVLGECVPEPCWGVCCDEGYMCVDGDCVEDPCFDVECPDGEICSEGTCVTDCCYGIECAPGYTCIDGQCEYDRFFTCEGEQCTLDCEDCHVCYDDQCYMDLKMIISGPDCAPVGTEVRLTGTAKNAKDEFVNFVWYKGPRDNGGEKVAGGVGLTSIVVPAPDPIDTCVVYELYGYLEVLECPIPYDAHKICSGDCYPECPPITSTGRRVPKRKNEEVFGKTHQNPIEVFPNMLPSTLSFKGRI